MQHTPDASRPDEPAAGVTALVDATAGRVAAAAFAAGSFLRQRRIFHPDGIAFEATLTVDPQRRHGARLLDEAAEHRCTVRLSRGVGLPEGTQDVLGVALRVHPQEPAQGAQDLLFASVLGDSPVTRHVLAPAPTFGHRPLSTILPHRTQLGLVSLTLHAREPDARGLSTMEAAGEAFQAGRLTFELRATTPREAPMAVGHLQGGRRISREDGESLRFNPFNATDDLQPAGSLNALRRRAYRASQTARPTIR